MNSQFNTRKDSITPRNTIRNLRKTIASGARSSNNVMTGNPAFTIR